jgi:hypothetical protein
VADVRDRDFRSRQRGGNAITVAGVAPSNRRRMLVISGQWSEFWIYLVAPLLGAVTAVVLLRIELFGKHRVPIARVAKHD